jgi:hypothetical protein
MATFGRFRPLRHRFNLDSAGLARTGLAFDYPIASDADSLTGSTKITQSLSPTWSLSRTSMQTFIRISTVSCTNICSAKDIGRA